MDAKNLRNKLVGSDDERAVSPVIGVILMVAITVILAAVIATLVMDLSGGTEVTPTTDFDAEGVPSGTVSNGDEIVSFSIRGGENVESSNLKVVIDAENAGSGDISDDIPSDETMGTGQTISVTNAAGSNVDLVPGDTITLVWEGDETSSTMQNWEASDTITLES